MKEKTVIIEGLEIWPKDLSEMTWYEAKVEVAKLGPGWRLPTIEEFRETLFPNREKISNILSMMTDYWSSTEIDNTYACYFYFNVGNANYNYKYSTYYVRAVRDFNADVAIEYLLKDF